MRAPLRAVSCAPLRPLCRVRCAAPAGWLQPASKLTSSPPHPRARRRLFNDFIWNNVPTARTDALPYHHPTYDDMKYNDYRAQFEDEAAAAS